MTLKKGIFEILLMEEDNHLVDESNYQEVKNVVHPNDPLPTPQLFQYYKDDTFKRYFRNKFWFQVLIRFSCIVSVISVCVNTPQTFKAVPSLARITLTVDILCTIIFGGEALLKISSKGLAFKKHAYFRNPGRAFEFVMLLSILVSVILQSLEMINFFYTVEEFQMQRVDNYVYISMVRALRPLLLLRVIKLILDISLPRTVSLRSLKQIYGVLLFSAYFMSLAAVIGVQLFGLMKYYCVKSTANVSDPKMSDFLIPASRCSLVYSHSFQCPTGYACRELKFKHFRQDHRYFEHIFTGLLTVYEAASMEGWSEMMYDAMDTRHFAFAVVYYIAVIFFIAWLVKNVFIAIITEAFADLRVRVSRLSKISAMKQPKKNILQRSDKNLEFINIEQSVPVNAVSRFLFVVISSPTFKGSIYLCILADSIMHTWFYDKKGVYYLQTVLTIVFNIEAILKMIAMGVRHYCHLLVCRFELLLCVGSTVFLPFYLKGMNGFALFQVLRVFRLLLISSTLTCFLKRIIGSGKKIGSLLLFSLSALLMASGVALQLFCGIELIVNQVQPSDKFLFGTFPNSTVAIFQVFLTENWNSVMDGLLWSGQLGYSPLVFIVFISFHLLAATILLNIFVALILDNLELAEEVKIIKQRRQGVEEADTKESLPYRIRFFQLLKPRPKVVRLDHVNDCNLPSVRQNFVGKFISPMEDIDDGTPLIADVSLFKNVNQPDNSCDKDIQLSYVENKPSEHSFLSHLRKQSSVSAFITEVHNKRSSVNSSSENTSQKSLMMMSMRRNSTRIHSQTNAKNDTVNPLKSVLGFKLNEKRSTLQRGEKSKSVTSTKTVQDIDVDLVREKLQEAELRKKSRIDYVVENHPTFEESLFIFTPHHPLRRFVQRVVHARYQAFNAENKSTQVGAFTFDRVKRYFGSQTYLEWVMLVFTQVSCIAMMWENSETRVFDYRVLATIEYIFVISTTIELALKIIADGLLLTPNAFIQDVGGVLHVFIYIVSLTHLIWQPTLIPYLSGPQWILVFRALRPLRIITLAPPLRKVVYVLLRGYRDIIKVAILQGVVMFVFASYGVQTFGGRLKKCNDMSDKNETECRGRFRASVASPRNIEGVTGEPLTMLVPMVYQNPRNFNFDNMGYAFLTLLELLSLEGWTDIRDILQERFGWLGGMYPHAFVVTACVLGLTLFIGVIVSNFNGIKGTALLTVEQKRWKDLKKKLELTQPLHIPSRPNCSVLKAKLYDMFNDRWYNRFYALVVFLNVAALCRGQWQPTDNESWMSILISISVGCCFYFLLDMMLKVYAISFKGYWLSWKNRFDFVLTLLGIVFSIWTLSTCGVKDAVVCGASRQFGVVLFIFRFLSLCGKHNDLQMLMLTVVMSLTKSFYTIAVMLMIMACYAFVGVILFGAVKHGLSLNRHANFETSWSAMILMFRVTTGENWNQLMHDASLSPPYCKIQQDKSYWHSNCGNYAASLIFFHSFYLIISYIFLNLFIAVVIENFSIFYSTDDDPIMSQQDIRVFQEAWKDQDQENCGSVSVPDAQQIIHALKAKLKLYKLKSVHPLLIKCMCAEVEKVRNGKNVFFHDLLFVLAYKKIDISKNLQLEERLSRTQLEESIKEEVAGETIREWVVKIIAERKLRKRNLVERKVSGLSADSRFTMESLNSDVDDAPSLSNAYQFDGTEIKSDLTGKFNSQDIAEDSDVYHWWDEQCRKKTD